MDKIEKTHESELEENDATAQAELSEQELDGVVGGDAWGSLIFKIAPLVGDVLA